MKPSDIVKPSDLGNFLRLQLSCLTEEMSHLRFLARFDHCQQHLPGKPVIELIAVYEVSQTPNVQLSFLVTDRMQEVLDHFDNHLPAQAIARELGVAWIELAQGIQLKPVEIAKPWGKEIWYTGIEQRGVSQVISPEGVSPLDWALAAAHEHILAGADKLILLKILDPLRDEVYGDLYFEMHEEKQEVYVVTHIDPVAWPGGVGGIRFGFNQALRSTFTSEADFRQSYATAVQNYRAVRQEIDRLYDNKRQVEGIALHEPVMPDKLKQWQATLPAELVQKENELRHHMENHIAIKPLQLGDVVKVPCYTPHSLQHGVRTVEFQTPVYERKILSFAQKVLTQDHWDTDEALRLAQLQTPADEPFPLLRDSDGVTVEQIVAFEDFTVLRIYLQPGVQFNCTMRGDHALLMTVTGEVDCAGVSLAGEQAALLPAGAGLLAVRNIAGLRSELLLAQPS